MNAAFRSTIGGTTAAARNIIAGNIGGGSSGDGIQHVSTGTANSFLGNSIYANSGLGIDLGINNVTLNDADDGDAGANDLLNFPVIISAAETAGTLDVDFELDVPAGDYRIEFFTNPSGADPSGNGEGEIFADALKITHGGTGVELFNHTFAGSVGDILSSTATEESAGPAYGATSEFSAAFDANPVLVLELVKRAFLPDGTPIPTGATIPSGLEFKYLLYINNTGAARSDISVRDALDPAFLYQAGTIQVDNSVAECAAAACTAGEELTIFAAVDGATVLSDALGDDVVSYAAPNLDAGDGNAGNLQLDINADMVWAMLFSVRMP